MLELSGAGGVRFTDRILKISVVTPCFNSGPLIEATVESALAQTLRPHEVLLLDDGSTDDTWQRLEGLRSRYGDILRLFRREKNRGSAMRNDLIEVARGNWIANLDHDDLWEPTKLEKQVRAHRRHPRAEVVHTDGWNQPGDADSARSLQETPDYQGPINPHEALFFRNFILASSALYQRKTFYQANGRSDENEVLIGDIEMWLRLSLFGARFVRVPEPLMTRRVLPTGQLAVHETLHLRQLVKLYTHYEGLNRQQPRFRTRDGRRRVIRAELDFIHHLLNLPSREFHEEAAERWVNLLREWEEADRYRTDLIRLMALTRLDHPKFGPPAEHASRRWRAPRLSETEEKSLLVEWTRASRDEAGREAIGRETARLFRMGTASPPFLRLREREMKHSQRLMDRAWARLERHDRRRRWFRR